MPPKKTNEPSKKSVEKQKQKIIEDKTFGLKNKKGAKNQKYIEQVQKQVTHGNKSAREIEQSKQQKLSKKEIEKREREELNALFKPVTDLQKIAKGVDPKSVLCVFYKQGACKKGDKCKFSHDLMVERKTQKRSLYDDNAANGGEEGMESWDQEKLEDVVNKKHGDKNKSLPPTSIICRYFLDAVENSKYGWFWSCPNGETCHYRHALPPGFVLKKDKKKMEEQQEKISLEELIEKERQALTSSMHTPVTLESFLKWKKRKKAEKREEFEENKAKRRKDFSSGRVLGVSGREVFEFRPELVVEEVDEEDTDVAVLDTRLREDAEDTEDGFTREIRLEEYDVEALEKEIAAQNGELIESEEKKMAAATGGDDVTRDDNEVRDVIEVDENLFADDDLDELDDELNNLEIDNTS